MDNDAFFISCLHNSVLALAKLNTIDKTIYYFKSECPRLMINHTYTFDEIYDLYTDNFIEFRNIDKVFNSINSISPETTDHSNVIGSKIPYRRLVNGEYQWARLCVAAPGNFSMDNPFILIYSIPCSEIEAQFMDIQISLEENLYSIYKVNLLTDELKIYAKQLTNSYLIKNYKGHSFDEFTKIMIDTSIVDDDKPLFDEYMNRNFLIDYFKSSSSRFSIYYRRLVGNMNRWVQCSIFPSSEYTDENPVINIISTDAHTDALKYIALASRYQYQYLMERKNHDISENFYDDVLSIVSTLTESYIVFLTVDLDADIYLSYKVDNIFHNPYKVPTQSYSDTLKKYVTASYSKEVADTIISFASIENIRFQLKDKNIMELKFTSNKNIPCKFTIVKMRSKDGLPLSVLCTVTADSDSEKLLKIQTFGNFEVYGENLSPIHFEKKKSKEVLAYLVDKKGYPVSINDIIIDVLERSPVDLNAKKYASGLLRKAMKNLTEQGYPDVIIEQGHLYRVNTDAVDCDYYHLANGNISYWSLYHNEYMKEYSWAEATNGEIVHYFDL